jgi:hypothetical protein
MVAHRAEEHSLDLLALMIPGGHWRFAALTEGYWSQLTSNIHEHSVYLGWGVLFLVIYAWRGRRAMPGISYWYIVLACFAVLALGPVLHVWGETVPMAPLPYSALPLLFPPLKLAGVPLRMVVMVTLATGVIAALGARLLWEAGGHRRWALVPLLILIGVEHLSRPIPASAPETSELVEILQERPGRDAYIEFSNQPLPEGIALYFQTQHEQPMAFGYTSRTTVSVHAKEEELRRLAAAGRWTTLACTYRFRWLLTDTQQPMAMSARVVTVLTRTLMLYDIGTLCGGPNR